MSSRVITYIDGFNLYFGLKESNFRRFYWLDLQQLAERLLTKDQTLERVKYFTSRISNPPDKRKRQSDYIEALQTLPKVEIHFGKYRDRQITCRKCRFTWSKPEEKMTDVRIATQLMSDAQSDRFDTAILVSGDSDLIPPIEAIKVQFPRKRIVVAFPPKRQSIDLRYAASGFTSIGRDKLGQSLLPPEVETATGFKIKCPTNWT